MKITHRGGSCSVSMPREVEGSEVRTIILAHLIATPRGLVTDCPRRAHVPEVSLMERRVLVVGAGLAGLSAARELSHRGYHVTVLEARNRVGGRLCSKKLDDSPSSLDLGAAFIHGVDQNPVASLAQELGLSLIPMDECKLLGSDGQPVAEVMDQRIQVLWNKVLDECAVRQQQELDDHVEARTRDSRGETTEESHGEGSSSTDSDAAEETMRANGNKLHIASMIEKCEVPLTQAKDGAYTTSRYAEGSCSPNGDPCPRNDVSGDIGESNVHGDKNEKRKGRMKMKRRTAGPGAITRSPVSFGQVLEETARPHLAQLSTAELELWGWHRGNLEISCGADLSELDHLHWNQDDVYDFDGDHVVIKEGYEALSSKVAATLDIRLNTEVKMIRLDDAQLNVEVVATSGEKTTSLRAGYVVVTLPLGVLKSRAVSFNPALSNAKLAAIRSMGMGTLNKVVLHFTSVFWDQVDFLGHVGKDRRRWLLFMDMSRITNRPILVAMTGGPFAVFLERLGDTEIVRRAMTVVRTVYASAPDPIASQVTIWKGDRFSRGSFSFIPPGCSAREYDVLAEPVYDCRGKPRVLFAGEATTRFHPSTVHGAWLTGLREATRLDFHARAGWHRKGRRRRDDDFSPDVMYETSVLFNPKRCPPNSRARVGAKRGPPKNRVRPTKQADGTDCRRSPRLDSDHGRGVSGKRKRPSATGPAGSLRMLPHRLDGPTEAPKRHDDLRNMSNEGRKLPLSRPASHGQEIERENGRGDAGCS